MNRIESTPVVRQSSNSSNIPRKSQKLFNVQTEDQAPETFEGGEEVNFMTDAYLAYPI